MTRQTQRLLLKYYQYLRFSYDFCTLYDTIFILQTDSSQPRSPWDDPLSAMKNSADFGFSSNLIDSVSSLPKPSAIAAKDLSTLLHSMGLTKYIGSQPNLTNI